MSNHPNRSKAAQTARAYVAALPGVQRVRVDARGVWAYGAREAFDSFGWYLAGTVDDLAAKAAADQPTNGR